MTSRIDIRSGFLYKLFFHPSIHRCQVAQDIRLSGSREQLLIQFDDLKKIHIAKGIFFNSLTFACNEGKSYRLNGLSSSDAEKAHSCIRRLFFQRTIDSAWPQITSAYSSWRSVLNSPHYVTNTMYAEWVSNYHNLDFLKDAQSDIIELPKNDRAEIILELQNAIGRGREIVDARNNMHVSRELNAYRNFLNEVEKYPLTDNQRLAVLHDEDCNLVVAGAGTGKTSTIIAKVGYLLEAGLASPDEILLLAFTQKAAKEMRERIEHKFKATLNVRTFHALGLEIIGEATGKRPSLCKEAEDAYIMRETLKRLVEDLLKDGDFRRKYLSFQVYYRVPYRPTWKFDSLSDYKNYLRSNDIRALSRDRVKSFEECVIANWLYTNGVSFEYEADYEVEVADREHRQYRPDFYLPDHGIYIEHFAIDKDGNTPSFIDQQRYTTELAWKHKLHEGNQTRLVETYSWQQSDGTLLAELEQKLRRAGVLFKRMPDSDVLKRINELGQVDAVISLLASFQSLFKSSGDKLSETRKKQIAPTTRSARSPF